MPTITITGVIVYRPEQRSYSFMDFLAPSDFEDGQWSAGSGMTYVLICPHTITIEAPANLDLITPQLKALDEQERAAAAAYTALKTQLEAKRQSLLAIECDPEVA